MTSVFRRCSAASPVGFAAAVGLSFADTQLATPGSGGSRPELLYTAQTSWLWRHSRDRSTHMKESIRRESSSWFSCPAEQVSIWVYKLYSLKRGFVPVMNSEKDSLYKGQLSPIAVLRAEYMGSTSTLGEMAMALLGRWDVLSGGRGFVDIVGVRMLCRTDSARLIVAMAP